MPTRLSTRTTIEPYYGLMDAIRRRGKTYTEMANLLKITTSTFSRKINRKDGYDFYYSEAYAIAKALNISMDDFFCNKSF